MSLLGLVVQPICLHESTKVHSQPRSAIIRPGCAGSFGVIAFGTHIFGHVWTG